MESDDASASCASSSSPSPSVMEPSDSSRRLPPWPQAWLADEGKDCLACWRLGPGIGEGASQWPLAADFERNASPSSSSLPTSMSESLLVSASASPSDSALGSGNDGAISDVGDVGIDCAAVVDVVVAADAFDGVAAACTEVEAVAAVEKTGND